MRILKFIQGGELIQLGIEKKVLYLKVEEMLKPFKLGELKDIKQLSKQRKTKLNGNEIKVPLILKKMGKSITPTGLILAKKYSNEEFFQDFVNDYKEMSNEGQLNFLGVFKKWV